MAEEKTPEQIEEERLEAEKAEAAKAKKKTKFTPEQVEHVNELFNKAFKEGAAKSEELMAAKLAEEKAEREKLAKQLEDLQKATKPKEEPKTNPEIDQFKAQLAEIQSVLTGIRDERDKLKTRVETSEEAARRSRKKDQFLNALKEAEVNFFDPLEAYELAEKSGYEWDKDTDRPVVLNKETNRPKLNENGEPMSVVDFVKEFADKKKYLVKAPTAGGTGSAATQAERDAKTEEQLSVKAIEAMTPEQFEAFTQGILNKAR
jgi:hypothetical protein